MPRPQQPGGVPRLVPGWGKDDDNDNDSDNHNDIDSDDDDNYYDNDIICLPRCTCSLTRVTTR